MTGILKVTDAAGKVWHVPIAAVLLRHDPTQRGLPTPANVMSMGGCLIPVAGVAPTIFLNDTETDRVAAILEG